MFSQEFFAPQPMMATMIRCPTILIENLSTTHQAPATTGFVNSPVPVLNHTMLDGLRNSHYETARCFYARQQAIPIPSIATVTISPGLRYLGGSRVNPTPSGVPVKITVPGSRVVPSDKNAMISATCPIKKPATLSVLATVDVSMVRTTAVIATSGC